MGGKHPPKGGCKKITGSTSVETAVYHHTELILDAFRHIKPMELSVKKLRQAAVSFSCAGDHASQWLISAMQCSSVTVIREVSSRMKKKLIHYT